MIKLEDDLLVNIIVTVADEASDRHLYVHLPGNLHIRNDHQGKIILLTFDPYSSRPHNGFF